MPTKDYKHNRQQKGHKKTKQTSAEVGKMRFFDISENANMRVREREGIKIKNKKYVKNKKKRR